MKLDLDVSDMQLIGIIVFGLIGIVVSVTAIGALAFHFIAKFW